MLADDDFADSEELFSALEELSNNEVSLVQLGEQGEEFLQRYMDNPDNLSERKRARALLYEVRTGRSALGSGLRRKMQIGAADKLQLEKQLTTKYGEASIAEGERFEGLESENVRPRKMFAVIGKK